MDFIFASFIRQGEQVSFPPTPTLSLFSIRKDNQVLFLLPACLPACLLSAVSDPSSVTVNLTPS